MSLLSFDQMLAARISALELEVKTLKVTILQLQGQLTTIMEAMEDAQK